MSSAVFALVVNACLAGVVVIAFAALQRHMGIGHWYQAFSASYLIGVLTPLSELAIRFELAVPVFMLLSYASFLAAFLVFGQALGQYLGVAVNRWGLLALFGAGIILRMTIWGGRRDDLLYELCYQAPFAAALATSVDILRRARRPYKAETALTAILAFTSAHFVMKAFAASLVGSGGSSTEYHTSQYALLSQSATAVLLVAVAMSMMWVIIRDALKRASVAAETDDLSGLLNRRGFDLAASDLLRKGSACTAMMFDQDHFKAVNDEHGHAMGDEIIRCVSKAATEIAPPGSVVARTGGEEFSVLFPVGEQAAFELAETFRTLQARSSSMIVGRPVTVSIGLAKIREGGLSHAMRAADEALYSAKRSGRNRTCQAMETLDEMREHPLSAV